MTEMKVELISRSRYPDAVCNVAAGCCVSQDMPDLEMDDVPLRSLEHALGSGHESVAEHAVFSFAISGISRACSHQLVRHRMASYSQQSQRYVNAKGTDFVIPDSIRDCKDEVFIGYTLDEFECMVPEYRTVNEAYGQVLGKIMKLYQDMIEAGIPEEDARYILPNACTTTIVVTVNARELRHMASERMCNRAQWEIRALVTEMVRLAEGVAPTLMKGVGPKCRRLGYCPERKPCGKVVG